MLVEKRGLSRSWPGTCLVLTPEKAPLLAELHKGPTPVAGVDPKTVSGWADLDENGLRPLVSSTLVRLWATAAFRRCTKRPEKCNTINEVALHGRGQFKKKKKRLPGRKISRIQWLLLGILVKILVNHSVY